LKRAVTSPEEVLESALSARDQLDFAAVVSLCDPASIGAYHEVILGEARRRLEAWGEEYSGFPTSDEMEHLTPPQFAVRSLEVRDFRMILIRACEEKNIPVPSILSRVPEGLSYEIVRVEALGRGSVRVHYRCVGALGVPAPRSIQLSEELRLMDDGNWRLIFRDGLLEEEGTVVRFFPEELAPLLQLLEGP
jgi:hypothetical protein